MKFQPQIFAVVPPPPDVIDDDALASYDAMAEAVERLPSSTTLGDAILPCQRPGIELTVLDESDTPLANMPYRLLRDGASLAEGQLDEHGFIAIADKEVPPGEWEIEIELRRNATTQQVESVDILLSSAPTDETEEDQEDVVEEVEWLPFMEPPYLPAA